MKKGKVILVGAGPSDAGLITLKGIKALQRADVVVYDKLVGVEILNMIPSSAKRINVGKSGGNHPVPQEEINKILLVEAQNGNVVVRLKGGDPFMFGRGGEELELLCENNIAFEIVPGVTSAIAVPAYGGIPVTHRDYCSSLHIITGHTKTAEAPQIDFEALVRLKGTLVFLMGVGALSIITNGLTAAGMKKDTPVAIIEKGTTARQREVVSTIENIVADAKNASISPPSVIIVGEVCKLHDKFSWTHNMPLSKKRIVVTRPKELCSSFSERIREFGGEAIEFPCIKTKAFTDAKVVKDAINNIRKYGWIVFTSAFGVKTFFEALKAENLDVRILYNIKIAVVGSGTREEFEKIRVNVDLMPENYNVTALADELIKNIDKTEKILLFRAKEGSLEINKMFDENGVLYDDIPAYETVFNTEDCEFSEEIIRNGDYDYAAFTSASTVKGFVNSLPDLNFAKVNALCIGEQTANEAKKYGMNVSVSQKATIESMVEFLIRLGDTND